MKGRLVALKGELDSMMKMLERVKNITENAEKVTVEDKLPCAICGKGGGSNSIHSSFAGVGCKRDVVVVEVN